VIALIPAEEEWFRAHFETANKVQVNFLNGNNLPHSIPFDVRRRESDSVFSRMLSLLGAQSDGNLQQHLAFAIGMFTTPAAPNPGASARAMLRR
jgi:hypothetical protein